MVKLSTGTLPEANCTVTLELEPLKLPARPVTPLATVVAALAVPWLLEPELSRTSPAVPFHAASSMRISTFSPPAVDEGPEVMTGVAFVHGVTSFHRWSVPEAEPFCASWHAILE